MARPQVIDPRIYLAAWLQAMARKLDGHSHRERRTLIIARLVARELRAESLRVLEDTTPAAPPEAVVYA